MTQDDFKVLAFLANRVAGVKASEIAGIDPTTARSALTRLEKAGYAYRLDFKEGNAILWKATSEGNKLNFTRSTVGRGAELKG